MWSERPGRGSTRAWRHVRARVLARDQTCQLAGPRCVTVPTEADHIVQPCDGGTDHETNLRAACHRCHADRTAEQATAARRGPRRPAPPHPGLIRR